MPDIDEDLKAEVEETSFEDLLEEAYECFASARECSRAISGNARRSVLSWLDLAIAKLEEAKTRC